MGVSAGARSPAFARRSPKWRTVRDPRYRAFPRGPYSSRWKTPAGIERRSIFDGVLTREIIGGRRSRSRYQAAAHALHTLEHTCVKREWSVRSLATHHKHPRESSRCRERCARRRVSRSKRGHPRRRRRVVFSLFAFFALTSSASSTLARSTINRTSVSQHNSRFYNYYRYFYYHAKSR